MKLEVGMYCYNKTNRKLGIGKITSFQCNNNVNIKYKNDIELVSIGNVIASFNVIDILEVGDYVNGLKVTSVNKTFEGNTLIGLGTNFGFSKFDNDYSITFIVTHEQMEQMAYKMGE